MIIDRSNSKRGDRIRITASLEKVSERSNTINELNTNDGIEKTSRTR